MVTPGLLPSRDTCTSLYIVGEGRKQDAEASPARIAARRRSYSRIFYNTFFIDDFTSTHLIPAICFILFITSGTRA